jgi:hypothetical protein
MGDMELRTGTVSSGIIVNVSAEEAEPPGVYAVTPAVPIVAISDARVEPCNWVKLTYVVVRSDPFH